MKEPSSHLYKDFKLRALADFIKELIRGRTNAVGTATLSGSGTVTVTNVLVSPTSQILITPKTNNAASGNNYVSRIADGEFDITSTGGGSKEWAYLIASGGS